MKIRAAIPLSFVLSCSGGLVDHAGVALSNPDGGGPDGGVPDGGDSCPYTVDRCGLNCSACPVPANATASCTDRACDYECAAPLLKCPGGCCPASAVSAGGDHACAIAGRAVRCWGGNDQGQLGVSGVAQSAVPVQVPGLESDATAVAAGSAHSCAVKGGEVYCWGANDRGQLGVSGTSPGGPAQVLGIFGASSVAAGAAFTCAMTSSQVLCWGANDAGQLGDGSTSSRFSPAAVASVTLPQLVATGASHACALSSQGVLCWGASDSGQVGSGSFAASIATPAVAIPHSAAPLAIGAGALHTCAVSNSDSLSCWGSDASFQLGDSSGQNRDAPRGVLSGVAAVAGGSGHTCALTRDSTVRCWGANASGQLGNGAAGAKQSGPQDVSLPTAATQVAAGAEHTCALLSSGGVSCWGRNDRGQLGNGTVSAISASPLAVTGR